MIGHLSTLMLSGKTVSEMQGETMMCDRADALGSMQCVIDGEHKLTRADDAFRYI